MYEPEDPPSLSSRRALAPCFRPVEPAKDCWLVPPSGRERGGGGGKIPLPGIPEPLFLPFPLWTTLRIPWQPSTSEKDYRCLVAANAGHEPNPSLPSCWPRPPQVIRKEANAEHDRMEADIWAACVERDAAKASLRPGGSLGPTPVGTKAQKKEHSGAKPKLTLFLSF